MSKVVMLHTQLTINQYTKELSALNVLVTQLREHNVRLCGLEMEVMSALFAYGDSSIEYAGIKGELDHAIERARVLQDALASAKASMCNKWGTA